MARAYTKERRQRRRSWAQETSPGKKGGGGAPEKSTPGRRNILGSQRFHQRRTVTAMGAQELQNGDEPQREEEPA